MKIYSLIGYYDIQFKSVGITLPKLWRGNWRIRIRRRSDKWWGIPKCLHS